MPRERKWKTNAERQKAYRLRKQLTSGKIPAQLQRTLIPGSLSNEELFDDPELMDTTLWSWSKWALTFKGIALEQFQINALNALDAYLRLLYEIPRRHGKTTIILEIFCLRKLAETVIRNRDTAIIYMSDSKDNVIDFVLMVADDLMTNERIIENYGYLLDDTSADEVTRLKKIKRSRRRQTQMVLNLGNRKDRFNHSLFGTTMKGAIRGKGAEYVLLDDVIDTFHGAGTKRKLTKKIMSVIKNKLYPIAEKNIALVGTRYDLDGYDIFSILEDEMDGRVWHTIKHKAIIVFGTYRVRESEQEITPADILIDDPDEWQILSHLVWELRAMKMREMKIQCTALQLLVYYYHVMDPEYFMQEFQNAPFAVGSTLKWEWLGIYRALPVEAYHMKWVVFIDTASGETEGSDYNGFSFTGIYKKRYYIHALMHGRDTPLVRIKKLEKFITGNCEDLGIDPTNIEVMIEVVRGTGQDFKNIVTEHSWITPKTKTPRGRGKKKERIRNNFGGELEAHHVFIQHHCSDTTQFKRELVSFPLSGDDHLLDCVDQTIYFTRKKGIVAGGPETF